MPLNDGELWLRPRRSDDPIDLKWEGDLEIELFGKEWLESSWRHLWDRRRRQAFWLLVGGDTIGEVELIDIRRGDRTAELRIGIARPELLSRGYGTRAIHLLLEHASSHLHLTSVYLRVRESNLRAVRCYQKCGFKKRGRLRGGRFQDTILLMDCNVDSWGKRVEESLTGIAVAETAAGKGLPEVGEL